MASVTITLTEQGRKKIGEIILDRIADEIFTRSQNNIVEAELSDTGFLLRSGNVIRSPNTRKIIYSAPYASYIEYGTMPHFPPIEPIHQWVLRKLGEKDPKAKQIAWSIAKKIQMEGTTPKPFLRNAVKHTINKYR